MTWFKIDDRAAFTTRVLRAGNEAFGAWVRAVLLFPTGRVTPSESRSVAPLRVWVRMCDAELVEWIDGAWRLHSAGIVRRVTDQAALDRLRRKVRPKRDTIFARDRFSCRYCGATETELTVDHFLPLSKGGTNDDANLVTACGPCNSRKGARTLEQAGMVLL